MGGNIPGENFSGWQFSEGEGIFQGGVLWVGIFRVGIPPGGISLEAFSSYSVSILIFQKIINKYNKTLNKEIYTSNSQNVAQNFFIRNFCFNEREILSTQSIKALKAMRSEKNVKAKVKCSFFCIQL